MKGKLDFVKISSKMAVVYLNANLYTCYVTWNKTHIRHFFVFKSTFPFFTAWISWRWMESDRRERIVSINSFTNSLFSIAGHLWDGLESNKCKYISLWWKFHTLTHERYQSCSVNGREKHLHRKFSLNREIVLKTPFLCQWRSWAAGFSKNEQLSTHIFSVMRRYRTRVSELVSKTVEPTWLMWPWWGRYLMKTLLMKLLR